MVVILASVVVRCVRLEEAQTSVVRLLYHFYLRFRSNPQIIAFLGNNRRPLLIFEEVVFRIKNWPHGMIVIGSIFAAHSQLIRRFTSRRLLGQVLHCSFPGYPRLGIERCDGPRKHCAFSSRFHSIPLSLFSNTVSTAHTNRLTVA